MIKKIIILGGGAAGWLTANHLAISLDLKCNPDVEVTLIESPKIPTVGVGEGTVPMMRETLEYFGIRETDFFRKCDATFKQSIKFVEWLDNPNTSPGQFYHHLFDYPSINEFNIVPYWLMKDVPDRERFAGSISPQESICEQGLAPKSITHPEYKGYLEYAYHLDAFKFSELLAQNAKRLGVKYFQAEIVDVNQAVDGTIESISTDSKGKALADLFIDCSGFSSFLLGKHLGVKFVDKDDVLFVDNAIAMQVPYLDESSPIASNTIATAKSAGWIWDIGLTSRRGVGHVYSSNHTSHDEAEKVLREYVGKQADQLSCRRIPMRVGHREVFWYKNCVAIGLAQGFVEPLEATGLLLFDATARMLAELMPANKMQIESSAKLFNQRALRSWEKVIDFIKLHYFLSNRDDSQFWIDNRAESSATQSLLDKLAMWKSRPPSTYDFYSRFETFNLDNYLYVLYGMNFETDLSDTKGRFQKQKLAQEIFRDISGRGEYLASQLEFNRELINKIHQFGMQKC
ncbi:MAG: tryptophan 7-halogenase [Kangiellaceae bacterium]|nr:tryptophan 7-halogenase [Kangiellaceae bacterium]MCW9018183.1 tryptophan 7-halogenase [Kangiellaceae bacterium]